MTRMYKLCLFVFITILAIGFGSHSTSANDFYMPKKIDFNESLQMKEFYTDLDGEWTFFERKLLTPDEVKDQLKNGMGKAVSLPDSFKEHTGDVNSYGTYAVAIKIPKEYVGKALAIHIPFQYSAYKFFIDQTIIAENGVVGVDSASHVAEMAPRTSQFIAQSDEIFLTIQVSSFNHIRGGLENSIPIGDALVVTQKFNKNMIITLFMNGSIFIVGLFMTLFAWYRRREHLFLIFGIFAMLISVRALFAVPFYYTLIFSNITWLWGTRLEYILTEATSMFYVILLWKWHEKEFSKKVMYGLVIIHSSLIVVTLFTQPVFFQPLFFNVFILAFPTFIYLVYVIYKSIRNKNHDAKINLIGIGFIFLAFFNDYAVGNNWYYSTVTLMLPAVGLYVLIHVILMSKNFADSVRKTEEQNKQLFALNASNEELAIRLQKEIKQKDDFLANTSHELRNPLHGLINITHSILQNRRKQLDEKTEKDLELQLIIGDHLSQTLGDLLDITRLKEQKIRLQKKNIDLQEITYGVVDMLKVLIENKNIQIEVQIPNDIPYVRGDKNRLIQILFNLLHNAIKYTDEGTITIEVKRRDEMVQIAVADTGKGMTEEVLGTIFEPYEQGDSSMPSMDGGFGLGLSICQQLVELHGGVLTASSIVGEGSIFTFILPLAEASFNEEIVEKSDAATDMSQFFVKESSLALHRTMMEDFIENTKTSSYKPKVLAVDDNPVNLKVLTNMLPENRYEVEFVTSGKEALKQIEDKEWDLVISDVMMPEMSGYELTRSIRENYTISELPILLLTARSSREDIYAGFIAGANDYVTKPVDAVELNVRVDALTNLQSSINERLWMEAAWLQAQIRPHFLLNTLNSIVSLGEIDTERMNHLFGKLIDYLHSSFYMKNLDKVVPLQDELDLIESYLYIEQERFGERLNVMWEVEEAEGIMIPPLSIQTLVENAVNHGVLKRMTGGTVTIRVRKEEDFAEIAVIDDGVGMSEEVLDQLFTIQPHQKKGIGLINTEQRLNRLYGKGLSVISAPNVGTTITFTVLCRE